MLNLESLRPVMQDALKLNIIVGPTLNALGTGGMSRHSYDLIKTTASKCIGMFAGREVNVDLFPGDRIPESVVQNCVIEALSCTSAYYAHIRLGELNLEEPMVAVANTFFQQLVRTHTAGSVLSLNLVVNYFDNATAIAYYREMDVDDFCSGHLHRPWIRYTLEVELDFMLKHGSVELVKRNNKTCVKLTELGLKKLFSIRDFLTSTGFLKRRAALERFTKFSLLEDYDELIESVLPAKDMRADLLDACGIQPSMRVLELGCGTGSFTIDTGLYRLVQPSGEIHATDPSLGMLKRARSKAIESNVSNVSFSSMAAEDISFNANAYDVVTGAGFMHFTDIEKAVNQIHRVLKPTGYFTTIYPIRFTETSPLFPDWFSPLLNSSTTAHGTDSMPESNVVPNALEGEFHVETVWEKTYATDYTVPINVVRFFVEIANLFEDSMNRLPWKAQQDMLSVLMARGQEIVQKYPDDLLRPKHPMQFVKAYAIK